MIVESPPDSVHPSEERPSLRARKKLATRHAIRRVAIDLVAERGFSHVTVEDIAEAAEVSARTFFNYFPSKEAAILGSGPEHGEALRRRLAGQPAHLSPFEAVRAVLVQEAAALAEELAELGGDPSWWLRRVKMAHVDPHLRAAQASHMMMIERAVAGGVAERLHVDASRDPYCMLLAGTAMGIMRSGISIWACGADTSDLGTVADAAFQAVADGFPMG